MTRGNKGLFSLARARYNRLRSDAVANAVNIATPFLIDAMRNIVLEFVEAALDHELFAYDSLYDDREFLMTPTTEIIHAGSILGVNVWVGYCPIRSVQPLWCTVQELDDIDFLAERICKNNPNDCTISARGILEDVIPDRVEKLAGVFAELLKAKFLAHESRPWLAELRVGYVGGGRIT